jgi:tRNA(Ile)-lysidine synthase
LKKKSPDLSSGHPLLERVRRLIMKNRLFTKDDSIVVAVSGGPDSMALLHLLSRMDCYNLFAVYIDHGLRPGEIACEIEILNRLCGKLEIPFSTVAVDVHSERQRTGSSPEEAARNLRYAALESERIRLGASVIAVAHTADDQAEEILLRLIRGSGLQGLCGMSFKREHIVRPLLKEKKSTLIEYLKDNTLSFSLDSSNRSTLFLRNRVRLDLLPFLEQNFNPAIRKNLLQTAEILRFDENLLLQLTQEIFERLVHVEWKAGASQKPTPEAVRIEIGSFLAAHPALQRRVLEKVFWSMGTAPGFLQIDQVRNLIANGRTGAEIHLGRGLRVWKTVTDVIFSHPGGKKNYRGSGLEDVTISMEVEGPGMYPVVGHGLSVRLLTKRPKELDHGELLLDADLVSFPLLLRNPLPKEKFKPLGSVGSKKITRFLSDAKILRQYRPFFPVLVSQEKIIAIAGLRIDHDFQVSDETMRFLVVGWRRVKS